MRCIEESHLQPGARGAFGRSDLEAPDLTQVQLRRLPRRFEGVLEALNGRIALDLGANRICSPARSALPEPCGRWPDVRSAVPRDCLRKHLAPKGLVNRREVNHFDFVRNRALVEGVANTGQRPRFQGCTGQDGDVDVRRGRRRGRRGSACRGRGRPASPAPLRLGRNFRPNGQARRPARCEYTGDRGRGDASGRRGGRRRGRRVLGATCIQRWHRRHPTRGSR